ncbi:MAG TPA: arsenic resistance N-acetyltransferase ArsN2 [Gammaproteobacteria bacterium]|nr:arsenic resistance N-acetyltransferase ArsN2 [Gammaproteobacteria bacterium]
MTGIAIRPFQPADSDAVLGLLRSSDLPVADVVPGVLKDFVVAHCGPDIVGVAGIERHGDCGLLRSVSVDAQLRGTGLGRRLVEAMETCARQHGIRCLYLLTTTADGFFASQGYTPTARERAPAAIQGTAEFSTLCPASSRFMMKTLQ